MRISKEETFYKEKHGIKIWVYDTRRDDIGFVYVECEDGHFQEFYDKVSTFVYHIIEGEGTFYLNGEATPVKAGDLIIAPSLTKIYYFGKLKMSLVTVPAWRPENEVHVRYQRVQRK